MICSKCGEVNSDNFRFCGMCGTVLDARPEVRVEARRPAGAPVPGLPRITNMPESPRPAFIESATQTVNTQVPSLSGPSMLGLDQPSLDQPAPNQPSMDSLRERAFSGLDSFFEPEQPKSGGGRLFLLLVLLAALGGAGWWTYNNYLGATETRKPGVTTPGTGESAADKPSAKPAVKDAAPAIEVGTPQAVVVPPAKNPEAQTPNAGSNSDTPEKPAETSKAVTPKIALGDRSVSKSESSMTTVRPAKLATPAAIDTGDADFRKGEAYLYGRGVAENCDEAVKSLKAASAKSNARARSAFGTMYATGHCVPRDLPTSYLWFAMALRVDPNNQILEKDLSAVWNQMTPPERQMATRMKQ